MHILVTGGTGLIGSAACAALTAAGHELTVWTRRARKSSGSVVFVTSLTQCRGDIDAVINLAGAGLADRRWSAAYKREIVASRVELTHQLVTWMASLPRPPRALISASAIGFYGVADEQVFSERDAGGSGFSADLCAQWEQAASAAASLGAAVTILRLGVVFARKGGALEKMTQASRFGVESWLGTGQQWLSWIHLDDVLRIIEHVLTGAGSAPVYNAVSPGTVRHRELAYEVGRLRRSWIRLGVPEGIVSLLAGEMAEELLTSGQRVMPEQLIAEGFEFRYPRLSEALADLL